MVAMLSSGLQCHWRALVLAPTLAFAVAPSCTRAGRRPPSTAPTSASITTPAAGGASGTASPGVDEARMYQTVQQLASDAFNGRYSLHAPDIQQAANYLGGLFAQAGVPPVGDHYRVPFDVVIGAESIDPPTLEIRRGAKTTAVKTDGFTPLAVSGNGTVTATAVFVGYAAVAQDDAKHLAYDDLADIDVKGKVAVVLLDVPNQPSASATEPRFDMAERRLSTKLARLEHAGAKAVVLVRGPHSFDDDAERQKDALPDLASDRASNRAGGTASMLVVQMGWQAADRLLRIGKRKPSSVQRIIDETLRPQSRALPDTVITVGVSIRPRTLQVPNVLATIPGTDLAHEVFILGAHYDHIGTHEPGRGHCPAPGEGETDTICNGADDNASGTAVVVEVARALAESGYRPRRSLVFACFAAEEIGLFGSKALADAPPDAPPFRGGKVAAMVNIDMVGRLSERGLYIGGVGSSSGWMPLLDDVGSHTLPVLYDRATSTRSDQASFYRHDVPVLFFFTGVHADYHAPGDEADGIHREALKHIADLVLELTRRAGDGAPLPFSPPASPAEGLVRSLPGDNPDTIEKRVP